MRGERCIDVSFDVRSDAGGKDPDSHSGTLRRYHRLLWGRPLPNGAPFELDARLHHASGLGEWWLTSDAITHTYSTWDRPARLVEVIREVPDGDMTAFYDLGCTVGAYTVFPSMVHVEDKWRHSINQSRGIHPKIRDRFDLTLECIRRHYQGIGSPLTRALAWHSTFFAIFGAFAGFVDHFLLNDLVTNDYRAVRFLTDFDDFVRSPLPVESYAEYVEYMRRSIQFIQARNHRIGEYAATLQTGT